MAEIKEVWLHAHQMIRAARQIINEQLRPLNLSSAEGNVLLHLLTHGPELGQEQLVEQLDISKPAISRVLEALERKGYVTRPRDAADGRARRVRLTVRARRAGPAITQVYNRVYALALQGISAEELETFVGLFGRMARNIAREQQKVEAQDAAARQ